MTDVWNLCRAEVPGLNQLLPKKSAQIYLYKRFAIGKVNAYFSASWGHAMEFLNEYADHIGEFFTWISNPDSTVPVVKLLQAFAAVIGALVTTLGAVKTWKYAESRLGDRLTEFLEREEEQLAIARKAVADLHSHRIARKRDEPVLFSNRELNLALKQLKKRRFSAAETLLTEALKRTQEREEKAQEKASLHGRQKAIAHLLLGTIADNGHKNDEALAHFKAALEIDETDVQALEYSAVQLLKLGHAEQAREEFEKLVTLAQSSGDALVEANALRGIGKTWEHPAPRPSPSNANSAYKEAIAVFPDDGPILDLAYIHELRGLANLQLPNNRPQTSRSLTDALVRYTRLEHGSGRDAKEGAEGVKRINAAFERLAQSGSAVVVPQDGGATISSTPPAARALMGLGKYLGNQSGKRPASGERPN